MKKEILKPYHIHEVFYIQTEYDMVIRMFKWWHKGTKMYLQKFPHLATYKDDRISDKEMVVKYISGKHTYNMLVNGNNIEITIEGMILNNLHPHEKNIINHRVDIIAV